VSPPRPGVLRLTVNGRSVSNPQWFPGQIVNGLPTPLSGTAAATANKHWEDLEKFPTIVARLAGMVDRFTSMLDCVDVAFLPDGILDQLPTPSQIGATRTGGLDINKPRTRAALAAVLALAVSPDGFTVADLAAKVHTLTGQSKDDYTVRQAAYDLRKLRGKQFVVKPGPIRRYPYGVPLAAQARQQLSGRNGPGGGPPGCNTATTNAGRLIERCRMRPAPRRNREWRWDPSLYPERRGRRVGHRRGRDLGRRAYPHAEGSAVLAWTHHPPPRRLKRHRPKEVMNDTTIAGALRPKPYHGITDVHNPAGLDLRRHRQTQTVRTGRQQHRSQNMLSSSHESARGPAPEDRAAPGSPGLAPAWAKGPQADAVRPL